MPPYEGSLTDANALQSELDSAGIAMHDTVKAPPLAKGPSENSTSADSLARRGRFVLLRKLGEGGMGEVFVAYDEQLDRRVAIKLLHSDDASEEARLRLLREAQALARMAHPNVVTVFEVGQIDTDVFIAMEYIDGVTLRDWQEAEGRTISDIIDAYIAAGRGLAAVHEAGLVHRDFKPTNVMVSKDDRVRILDFGLAHGRSEAQPKVENVAQHRPMLDSKLTMTGAFVGTPAYMSPEQHQGEKVDSRSDQFSFCIALYEAVYRKHPFGDKLYEMLRLMLEGKALRPPTGIEVPERVRVAIMRGLDRKPEDRFANMNELLGALEEEREEDPLAHSWQRIVIYVILVLGSGIQATRTILEGEGAFQSIETLLIFSTSSVVFLLAGGYIVRKSLLRNRLHLQMLVIGALSVALMTMSRLLGMVQGDPWTTILDREIWAIFGLCLTAPLFLQSVSRWIWLPAIITFTSAASFVLLPQYRHFVAMLGFNTLLYGYIFAWSRLARAARNAPAAGHASHTSTSRLSRKVPSR
jgi:tRNA A-37 threonylcarbamoyl transferase component Bud32